MKEMSLKNISLLNCEYCLVNMFKKILIFFYKLHSLYNVLESKKNLSNLIKSMEYRARWSVWTTPSYYLNKLFNFCTFSAEWGYNDCYVCYKGCCKYM